MRRRTRALLLAAALAMTPAVGEAQNALTPLAVGTKAPDFTLVASTRAGVGEAVRLSDYHGKTIVLAFFFRARTKG